MSTDGVLGAVWLPTDGWLDPSGLANALAAGARQRGAADPDAHAGRRDRHGSRPGHRRDRRARGRAHGDPRRRRGQRRRHVRARDRPAGRRDRPDHPDGPPVPLHRADRGRPSRPAAAPRPGQPRLLPRGGRRPVHGRLRARSGAVVARRRPARLQRQAPGARLAALRSRSWTARSGASRRWPTPASIGSSTARRRSRRTTSSSSASRRSAGFFVAAGFSAHGIAGAGGIGRQMATWIVDGEPELDLWKMDIRRFGPAYRSQAYTLARTIEILRDLLRHPLPERGAPGRSPAADVADLRRAGRPRRVVRREVRLGAPELVRVERGRRRRSPPTARLGRRALVAGDRRRGARHAPSGRPVRRDLVRQARGRRAGRGGVPPADVRATTSTCRSAGSSTRSCSTAAAGSSAT